MESVDNIALFDFDGTITTRDTYKEFIKHCFGFKKTYFGFLLLSPIILMYKLRLLRNDIAKEITFSFFFKSMDKGKYLSKCASFKNNIDDIVRTDALKKIEFHRINGHYLVIVSASVEDWIRPWAEAYQFDDVIGTKIEIKKGELTGKFASKNCYGPQKVRRIKKHIPNISDMYIYAYGDSKGDKELLQMSHSAHYRKF